MHVSNDGMVKVRSLGTGLRDGSQLLQATRSTFMTLQHRKDATEGSDSTIIASDHDDSKFLLHNKSTPLNCSGNVNSKL